MYAIRSYYVRLGQRLAIDEVEQHVEVRFVAGICRELVEMGEHLSERRNNFV